MKNRTATIPPTGNSEWDHLVSWWLPRYKQSTQATYAIMLPRWTNWCAENSVELFAPARADLERYLREVAARGQSRASLASHWDAVASIYSLAYDEELIDRNPCHRVRRPKIQVDLQERTVLTALEYAAFLTAAQAIGPNEHAIAVLGGMMGLRATEMASLKVEDLSIVRGYSTLSFIGKGDKPARVPVPIPALGAIQACVDDRKTGPLLRTRAGTEMDRRDVYRYVVRTAKAAGINHKVSPHSLRRTTGTVALNQGIPLRDVQRLLRHAKPESTMRAYDVAGKSLERHASHQLAGFLSSLTG